MKLHVVGCAVCVAATLMCAESWAWEPPEADQVYIALQFDEIISTDFDLGGATYYGFDNPATIELPGLVSRHFWHGSSMPALYTNAMTNVVYDSTTPAALWCSCKQSAPPSPPSPDANHTVCLWYRRIGGLATYVCAAMSAPPDWLLFSFAAYATSGGLNKARFWAKGAAGSGVTLDDTFNVGLPSNVWMHIGWTFDETSNEMRCFTNGTYVGSLTTTYDYNSGNIWAACNHNKGSPAPGYYDDVYFWSTNLTDAQMLAMYQRGAPDTRGPDSDWHPDLGATQPKAIPGNYPQENSLVLYLDGTADGDTWADLSGRGHRGFSSKSWAEGPQQAITNGNEIIVLDGVAANKHHIRVFDHDDFSLTNEFTLACWVNVVDDGAGDQYPAYIAKWDIYDDEYNFWMGHRRVNPPIVSQFYTYYRYSALAYEGGKLSTTNYFGAWHHHAMTFDGVEVIGYLDGIEVIKDSTISVMPADVAEDIMIGADGRKGVEAMSLDEIMIWNTALTSNEVLTLYEDTDPTTMGIPPVGTVFMFR